MYEAASKLAYFSEKSGYLALAMKYMKMSNIYKDSIDKQTRTADISRIKGQFYNEKLKVERDKLVTEKRQQLCLNIVFAIILIMFVTLAYLFYTKYKIKEKFKKDQTKRAKIINEILYEKEKTPLECLPICSSIIQHSSEKEFKLAECNWRAFHNELNAMYPNFIIRLRAMYPRITDIELTACCLIKLNIPNSVMAKILSKTDSGMTNIRKRLYEKIHGQAGRPQQLDDFIRNIS